jgi:FixJ family two-component response regulator
MSNLDVVHVVDDDAFIRYGIELLLTANGFVVETYSSAEEFLAAAPSENEGCVLTDLNMPGGMSGIDLLSEISHRRLRWPVILMTAQGTNALKEKAQRMGASDFLAKPFAPKSLVDAVRTTLRRREGRVIGPSARRPSHANF